MNKSVAFFWVLILLALAVFGCGGKAFDYQRDTEIPEGPGVFSKEKGEFTIYSDAAEEPDAAGTDEAASADADAASAERDFEAFQQWKQEQEELEEFRQWKKSAEGSKEYQEFQEWRRWKEYKEWKQSQ